MKTVKPMPKQSKSKTPSEPAVDRAEASSASILSLIEQQVQNRLAHLNSHIEGRGLSLAEADKDDCCNYWQGGIHALEELERRIKMQNA